MLLCQTWTWCLGLGEYKGLQKLEIDQGNIKHICLGVAKKIGAKECSPYISESIAMNIIQT
jgi:hypothetical protein